MPAVAAVGVAYATPVCALLVNHTKLAPEGTVPVCKVVKLAVAAGHTFETLVAESGGAVLPAWQAEKTELLHNTNAEPPFNPLFVIVNEVKGTLLLIITKPSLLETLKFTN